MKQPTMQPLSMLDFMVTLQTGQLESCQELLESIKKAEHKPHVMDDATVDRARTHCANVRELLPVERQQAAHWRRLRASPAQSALVKRYAQSIETIDHVTADITRLLDKIAPGTIDKIMAKSDLELGLEAMANMSPVVPEVTREQREAARKLDNRIAKFRRGGISDEDLFARMRPHMPELKALMDSAGVPGMYVLSNEFSNLDYYAGVLNAVASQLLDRD